jgi:hypothetical protein
MKHPPKIQRFVESRDLEALEPDPERVAGLWAKALASSDDSRKGLSPDNAISLGYQAGFQACTALLEAHGYRTKGSNPGHHYRVFYAISGLGYPELSDVQTSSEKVKADRTKSFYSGDPQDAAQVDALHQWLDALLPAVYRALTSAAPELAATLRKP